jgi:hypothetical protein
LFTAHGKEAGTTHGNVSRTAKAKRTTASWGTATATTHGSELGHGSDMMHGSELGHGNGHDARQRMPARQRAWTHGSECPHGNVPGRTAAICTHGSECSHGSDMHARQSSLPCRFGETHGKVFVAEPGFAVPVLPCVDARQCLCRAI